MAPIPASPPPLTLPPAPLTLPPAPAPDVESASAPSLAPALASAPALALPPALAPAGPAGLSRELRAPFPLDARLALSVHRRGGGDPAYAVDATGAVWRTSLTPEGPATLRVSSRQAGALVTAQAWGPGASWLLDQLPAQLGFYDERTGFNPKDPIVADLARHHENLRIGRTGLLFEALVPAVLEQKVVSREAHRAWRYLLTKFGTPAPGPAPAGMRVFPPPQAWARIPSWDWHRAGVEGVRARTIITAAQVAGRLEQTLALPPAETDRRLRALPGIGVWTSAEIRQRAAGDPDAVSVGDYNLPKAVGWTLAGRITDDAGMLDLLAAYAGHRYRVTRLIELGGARPPRHGPRMSVRDYRAF